MWGLGLAAAAVAVNSAAAAPARKVGPATCLVSQVSRGTRARTRRASPRRPHILDICSCCPPCRKRFPTAPGTRSSHFGRRTRRGHRCRPPFLITSTPPACCKAQTPWSHCRLPTRAPLQPTAPPSCGWGAVHGW